LITTTKLRDVRGAPQRRQRLAVRCVDLAAGPGLDYR
jgi:hypothetical protein